MNDISVLGHDAQVPESRELRIGLTSVLTCGHEKAHQLVKMPKHNTYLLNNRAILFIHQQSSEVPFLAIFYQITEWG